MAAKSDSRGHALEYQNGQWIYSDTGNPIFESRPCKKCDKSPGNGGIDPCLKPMIEALNRAGIETVSSCCGHGRRPGNIALKDGRELMVFPDYKTSRRIDRFFRGINGEAAKDI